MTSDMTSGVELPPEVTDEEILSDLTEYKDAGMLSYVLPSVPLGETWVIGWNGQILKFTSKEGIVGFLTGIGVCATFIASQGGGRL